MVKGILLVGGSGSRLSPLTEVVSKQLLPIYDKPMVYYPLSILMLAGIRDILVISAPEELDRFKKLLKDGSQWGINLQYAIQNKPEGIAQAFLIAENFIDEGPVVTILGDNIFHGSTIAPLLKKATYKKQGATIFASQVEGPERYGVVEIDDRGKVVSIIEKPSIPLSNYAVTGLYVYDARVVEIAKSLTPSKRGELEITDINNHYLKENTLNVELLGRGSSWLDAGTFDSLIEASVFIQTIQKRQNTEIACLEEIAYNLGYIDAKALENYALTHPNSDHTHYLLNLLKTKIQPH